MKRAGWFLTLTALAILLPVTAEAYVGPGAGLGVISSIIAVFGAVIVALVGVVMFPITLLRKRRRERATAEGAAADPDPAPEG